MHTLYQHMSLTYMTVASAGFSFVVERKHNIGEQNIDRGSLY